MIHPYEVREVIGTGGMAERKSAYPHQTEGFDDGCADSLSYGTAAFTTCAFCSLLKAELR